MCQWIARMSLKRTDADIGLCELNLADVFGETKVAEFEVAGMVKEDFTQASDQGKTSRDVYEPFSGLRSLCTILYQMIVKDRAMKERERDGTNRWRICFLSVDGPGMARAATLGLLFERTYACEAGLAERLAGCMAGVESRWWQ